MDTTPPPMTPPGAAAPPPGMPPVAAATEDKTVAIVCYLTLLGFIAAIIIHSNKKTQLGAFHLRQMLGLLLTGILGVIPLLGLVVVLCVLVLWIMGIISAIQGQMKPVPVVGPLYQKWFGSTFS